MCAASSIATVEVDGSELRVVSVPGPAVPLLVDWDHQVALMERVVAGERQPMLVLKMAKRHALRLDRLLEGIDGVSLQDHDGPTLITAWAGTDELGLLARLDLPVPDGTRLMEARSIAVVVAGGGASRPSFRPGDIQSIYAVAVRDSER